MGGEDHFVPDQGHCLLKAEPHIGHFLSDEFNACKDSVAFVEMVHIDIYAQGTQSPHPAHSEDNFLSNTVFFESTV